MANPELLCLDAVAKYYNRGIDLQYNHRGRLCRRNRSTLGAGHRYSSPVKAWDMDSKADPTRGPQFWTRLRLVLILFAALLAAGIWKVHQVSDEQDQLSVRVDTAGIRVFTMGTRPYIITDLYGYLPGDTGAVVAHLSPPIVLPPVDSASWSLDPTARKHLHWFNQVSSEPDSPPEIPTIRVLYYQPSIGGTPTADPGSGR